MSTDIKILVVEDDERLARFLVLELTHEGYDVESVHDGTSALELFDASVFHLVLLDIMLPQMSGSEVCRRIRKGSNIPIIMLTAKDNTSDKVFGLDMGADDYVTKPFEIEELFARIRAVLRKTKEDTASNNQYKAGDLVLDIRTKSVRRGGKEIGLTKREFELLEYLLDNRDIVLSRETLLKNVWGWEYFGDTNTVDVYIRYLRNKIDAPFSRKLIRTIRGFGYVINEKDNEE